MRGLIRRVLHAVVRNKLLFAAILVAAVAEAFFTKAPLVLVAPLTNAFTEVVGAVKTHTGFLARLMDELTVHVVPWVETLFGVRFASPKDPQAIIAACAFLAALCAFPGALGIYGVAVLTRYFATKVIVDLRNEVAAHLLRLPLRFFGTRRMGELISNVTTDTAVLHRAFTLAADHVIEDPLLILMNVLILAIAVPETLWLLIVIVPAMAIPMIRMGKRVHKTSSKSLAAMGSATESMNQMLTGIKTVKAFQLEGHRLEEFELSNANFLHRTKRMLQAKGLSEALTSLAYTLGFAGLITFMGWLVTTNRYTAGEITFVLLPLSTTYTHVKRLSRAYNTLMESVGALDGIEEILATPVDTTSGNGRHRLDRPRGEVELQAVSFRYGNEPVLRDVSFKVTPGQSIALVGPSGAGKTTTLDVLARFHDPDSGRVLIDGVDLKEVETDSYRTHIAIVSQQPFVFNTTVGENIRYGRPDATQTEIEEAAKKAQIHDFIAGLPHGYQTICGERGCNLSGGQLQRLTIARAIVRDPAILFLDEATSSLDSESEQLVQKALENLMRGRTSFIIAHRLATTRNADLILVMDDGRVVEQGRHQQLMEKGGLYARLCQLQQLA